MKLYTILLAIIFLSCKDKIHIENNSSNGLIKKHKSHLDDIKTPNGNIIKFKTIGNQFELQWNCNGKTRVLSETFDLNGSKSWYPKFVDESESYIFLRAGCGSPCWQGFFLPINKQGKEIIIHEYLAVDLHQNYVAYINYDNNTLEVLNIKNDKKQSFTIGKCNSAFTGYCIDSIYFEKDKLNYKWIPETYINSKKGKLISLSIKL